MLSGAGLAFGRCLGEYGSVVFIAGNKPYYTEITPLIIMSKLQEFDYESATAIALVTLGSIIPDPVWCESGAGKKYETYQREGCIMDEKKKQASGPVKWILIGISVIFLFVMLVLPLVVVVTQALSKGWQCYVQAVTDEYTLKALKLTLGRRLRLLYATRSLVCVRHGQ